jgi:thymidine phosphorylase
MDAARAELEGLIDRGAALEKFRDLVVAQGGDGRVVDEPARVLPQSSLQQDVLTPSSGYIDSIDALIVGEAARSLGAGRQRKGDAVDASAGVRLHLKVGAQVDAAVPWATIYASNQDRLDAGRLLLESSLNITATAPAEIPLIYGVVDRNGTETRRL